MSLAHELSHLKDAQDGSLNRNRMLKAEDAENPGYWGDGIGANKPIIRMIYWAECLMHKIL